MALESATYIDGLVTTNPTGTDNRSQGDDHIRLLKSTIKTTFPNINGAVSATDEELDGVIVTAGTLTASKLVKVDASKKIDNWKVDNIDIDGNTISSTDTNGNVIITPNGTGGTQLNKLKDYSETVYNIGSITTSTAVDFDNGNVQTVTAGASGAALTFSNGSASATLCTSITLIITNGEVATTLFPVAVNWSGGSAPTLQTSGVDIVTLFSINGTFYGFLAGSNMS